MVYIGNIALIFYVDNAMLPSYSFMLILRHLRYKGASVFSLIVVLHTNIGDDVINNKWLTDINSIQYNIKRNLLQHIGIELAFYVRELDIIVHIRL